MQCGVCGQDNPPEARFCSTCGSNVEVVGELPPAEPPPEIGVISSYGHAWRQLWKHFLVLFLIGIIAPLISAPGNAVSNAKVVELLHQQIRQMWGFGDSPESTHQDLFRTQYRGRRYSFGYPACPRLEDQEQLFRLLDVSSNIAVELTGSFQGRAVRS